jgi:hypothetical protein
VGLQVVSLGAWCDVVAEDDFKHGVSFRVAEYAVLADGRRVTLHDERGFDVVLAHQAGPSAPVDPWRRLTLEQLERDVRTTILPDDAEDCGEEHPWEWLCGLLQAHGVDISADELRLLPYDVMFSERLRARVTPEA